MTGIRASMVRAKGAVLVATLGTLISIGVPSLASAATTAVAGQSKLASELRDRSGELRAFYAERKFQPVWISQDGRIDPAVDSLLQRVETAGVDGLDPRTLKQLRTDGVRRALDRAMQGQPNDIARADVAMSQLFSTYVRAMRAAPRASMIYESQALAPAVPTARSALESAANSPSLEAHVSEMGWMHPLYAPLRDTMTERAVPNSGLRTVWDNLQRIRALPANPSDRYVLVDAASARLWMYENGRPVDSMKVVVGRPDAATPAMAGFIRHAIVNPYWNVPPDLVQRTIAKGVLKGGTKWLKTNGYEVLSSYDKDAKLLDPAKVNWKAVANGASGPYVRQKPGGPNFMGKVKYEFPNQQGIYLHDTPERALLKLDDRQLSNGCVRLEDAERFGRWLMGRSIAKAGPAPEQRIDLPTVVPVYITYLTAMPSDTGIAFRKDVYGRDSAPRVASLD